MPFSVRRSAGPLLSLLPILVVPGLGLLGGAKHPGQMLHGAVLMTPLQDAPMPTAPLAERRAYTRALHQGDLRMFQAKIGYWQAAAHVPGADGRHARVKLAQWQQRSQQTRRALNQQARRDVITGLPTR